MLKQRVITALVLLIVFMMALFVMPAWFMYILLMLIVGITAHEWANMLKVEKLPSQKITYSLLSVAGMYVLTWLPETLTAILLLLTCLSWIGIFYLLFYSTISESVKFYAGLLVLPVAGSALWTLFNESVVSLLTCCALVWSADTFAYFSGKKFGKIKLAPSISPGKTREGLYGAIVANVVLSLVAYFTYFHLDVSALSWCVFVVILTVASVFGDLFESKLKREAGIKDSGHILPGHGGFFDRVDGLIAIAPFFALFLTIVR